MTLQQLVAAELDEPVDQRVARLAAQIAGQYGDAAESVLFYGSCLRQSELDGLMLDFYVIVSSYSDAYDARWLAVANALLPPNVFPFEADGLVAKYAVLSRADFRRLASSRTRGVSVWARFAQPSRLVWTRDADCREAAIDAVAQAAPALLAAAWEAVPHPVQPLDLWRQAFSLTYGAELRAERKGRAGSVVDADAARYAAFTGPALALAGIDPDRPVTPAAHRRALRLWRRRRLEGKLLTAARLAKASLTFANGIDYLAWKINRHAGSAISITPWQRRWPLLGALTLLPRLLRAGAVR